MSTEGRCAIRPLRRSRPKTTARALPGRLPGLPGLPFLLGFPRRPRLPELPEIPERPRLPKRPRNGPIAQRPSVVISYQEASSHQTNRALGLGKRLFSKWAEPGPWATLASGLPLRPFQASTAGFSKEAFFFSKAVFFRVRVPWSFGGILLKGIVFQNGA